MYTSILLVHSIGTDHFSPNELLKPLFYLFAGVAGGGTFRREMQNALIKENKPLREAVLAGLKYLPNEIILTEKLQNYILCSKNTSTPNM